MQCIRCAAAAHSTIHVRDEYAHYVDNDMHAKGRLENTGEHVEMKVNGLAAAAAAAAAATERCSQVRNWS